MKSHGLEDKCYACQKPFSLKILDFHHIDPNDKESTISKLIRSKDFDSLYNEVKKCVPLCPCCHRAIDDDMQVEFELPKWTT